jgi:hypothetical protein
MREIAFDIAPSVVAGIARWATVLGAKALHEQRRAMACRTAKHRAALILIVGLLFMAAAGTSDETDHWPATNIVVHLSPKDSITIRRASLETRKSGRTWRGEIEGTGEPAMLMWWKGGRFSGRLVYRGQLYTLEKLRSVGGEVHAAVTTNPQNMPPRHALMRTQADNPVVARSLVAQRDAAMRGRDRLNKTQSDAAGGLALQVPGAIADADNTAAVKVTPISLAERQALAAKKITIDVMVLYTRKVASEYVDVESDLVAHSIAEANMAFSNSGIGNISLRLVHAQQIDYDEKAGEHFDHLYRMVDGVGAFTNVRALRNEKRADVVLLIVDDPSGCGLATRVGADAEEAFAVVHHACAALTYSIPHEIGHIIGARHDMLLDKSASPFSYGHGYVNGTKWRDIMSYKESCNGCPRLPFWSNPTIEINGEPGGTVLADNARVILEQAERVSKFR